MHGARFRRVAEVIAAAELAKAKDPSFKEQNISGLFHPKGEMNLERLVLESAVGPIGQPVEHARNESLGTSDGQPMNARYGYVIEMAPEDLPPANVFWSCTLCDAKEVLFIPSDRKKYRVGENAGMKFDECGGITIRIAAKQPERVPVESWLRVERGDYGIDAMFRLYEPYSARGATSTAP